MRKPFVAGNWKMNLDSGSSADLATSLKDNLSNVAIDVAICPPFVYLPQVQKVVKGTAVGLGAQDVYFEEKGAFTGEISVNMLKDVGCTYAIVGHSERRHVLGETDELINRKLVAAQAGGLTPILCVGELLEERDAGQTEKVVEHQVRKGLANLDTAQAASAVIAYEPVWAIGTGRNATAEQAQEVHAFIRNVLKDMFDATLADNMRIQYGGSVKPDNAEELMGQSDVDGALVGGASLKADDFLAIIDGCIKANKL